MWKHAITASDNNTEIKVWCCETWQCTQKLVFKSAVNSSELSFTAEIDRTSSYLVLSDIKNRGLFVLQIEKETEETNNLRSVLNKSLEDISTNSSTESPASSIAYIKSVSEFPLSSPILSFGIIDAAVRKYKCSFNDNYLIEELDDYDEENHLLFCVVLHMFIVQPKSVQECHVLYQPTLSEESEVQSDLSQDSDTNKNDSALNTLDKSIEAISIKSDDNRLAGPSSEHSIVNNIKPINQSLALALDNMLSSVNLMTSPKQNKIDNTIIHPNINLPTKPPAQISLMTPDSFNSPPGKITPEGVSNEVLSTLRMLAQASPAEIKRKSADSINILNLVNNKVIEEKEQLKIRQSVELSNNQILGMFFF